ncbi:MAG: DUF5671 domain-containing protein [Chloroflexota bacterium]|nr:DUF5671 domain-containing protein [Chloroflexota bacterium]
MKTIRRLYRYIVAFISLEVVLWGLIKLARATFAGEIIGGNVSQLAGSLSLILVGGPVFLLHWLPAQRSAQEDEEEYSSRIRAFFLYGALLATLIPIAQNALGLIDRAWLQLFQLSTQSAILVHSRNWIDNIIAIIMNGLIAGYIYYIKQKIWEEPPSGKAFAETRRLYRYLWVLYSLAMLVAGISQVLQYTITLAETIGSGPQAALANGLSLLIIGTPLWVFAWRQVQACLDHPGERKSLLRLIILYALSLIGVGGVLVPAGLVLDAVFLAMLGKSFSLIDFLTEISKPLSIGIPLGGVWFYYGRTLRDEIAILPKSPRRAGLRRIYFYIMAFFGLAAAFLGLHMLLSYLIDLAVGDTLPGNNMLRERLAAALATLLVGTPLWSFSWRPMLKQSAQDGESGDHARRSLVRKIYLYLVLFAGVIGVMASAGGLIFELLSALFGDHAPNLLRESLALTETLIMFALLLAYHWNAIRSDNRLAEHSLAARHAEFPVLILAPEIGTFTESIINALKKETESLPVVVHQIENGAPDKSLSDAKAVIIPSELSTSPPEAIRLWLQDFDGERVVIPTPVENWHWVFASGRELSACARQAAKMIRHLAEGEDISQSQGTSTWQIVLYILAGMIGLPLVFSLVGTLISFLLD